MLRTFRLLWSTLGDYYYEILPFTAVNLMWIICLFGLPLLGGAAVRALPVPPMLLVFLASLICIPPSFAGLFYAARQYADGANIGPRDFLIGVRTLFWRAWQLALADLIVGGLVVANFVFYVTRTTPVLKLIALPWLYVIIFWLMLQPFLFGLLVYQRDRRLLTTARNAALLVLANLGTSLGLLVIAAIFLLLSVGLGLPFLALTGVVGAIWFTRVLDVLLAKYPNTRRADEAAAGADAEDSTKLAPSRR